MLDIMNIFGGIIMIIIMIPNIIYFKKYPHSFQNHFKNRSIEILEQIGRYGCFLFMMINIPLIQTRYSYNELIYIVVNTVFMILYLVIWFIYFHKDCLFKSLSLSIIPSFIFIFSGIYTLNIGLMFFSLIFVPCHIYISYQNTKA